VFTQVREVSHRDSLFATVLRSADAMRSSII